MYLTWLRPLRAATVVALAIAATTACSDDAAPGGDGGLTNTASIVFDVEGGVLTAEPGSIVTVRLKATGPVDAITLALDGAYGDGSLDRASARVTDGVGEFLLRAPTTPATFAIQAVAGSARARLDVSVSRDGFATVRVTPAYKGKRPTTIVAASTFLKTKCSELTTFPAKDGAPLVVGTSGETLVVPKVPAGSSVAVAVRIARYATGCADLEALAPGTVRDVTVTLYDAPLAVGGIDLAATFTFDLQPQDRTALNAALGTAASQALASFFPDLEGKRLLDAMADATASSNDKNLFLAKRSQASWDGTVGTWLGAHGPTMQSRATTWMTAAAPKVPGDLHGHLVGTAEDKATFTPEKLGNLDATTIALSKGPFTIGADADDTIKLNGDVLLWPTRMLTVAAGVEAKVDFPASTSVPAALALAIDCNGLGTSLASNGYAFGTCDASCVAALCKKAIADRWELAAGASEKQGVKLEASFTASAATQFDDDAVPQSYTGTWLGQLANNVPAKGLATAIAYPK